MKFKPRFGRFKDSNVNPDEYMLRGFMSPEREARKHEFTTKLSYTIEKLKFEDLDALKKGKSKKNNK